MTAHAPLTPPPQLSLPLSGDYDRSSPLARRALVAGVLGAHVLGAWGLLQVESVRQAVGEVAPLMVDLIAPPAPPAAPPPPKTIPATAVEYVVPPAPVYPAASRRIGESGRVLIRVEIDTLGRARQVQLTRSSGSHRLDEAAMAAVKAARFKPYTENGEPLVVWTTVPIVFELES